MHWRSVNKAKLKTSPSSARRERSKLFQMSNKMIFSTKKNQQLMLFPNLRSRKSKSKSPKRTWSSPLKWVTSKMKIQLRPNPQKLKSKHKSSPLKTPNARKSHLFKVKSTNRKNQASLTWKRNAVANNKCNRPLAQSPTSSTTTTSTTSSLEIQPKCHPLLWKMVISSMCLRSKVAESSQPNRTSKDTKLKRQTNPRNQAVLAVNAPRSRLKHTARTPWSTVNSN